jgi:hypothetical protein
VWNKRPGNLLNNLYTMLTSSQSEQICSEDTIVYAGKRYLGVFQEFKGVWFALGVTNPFFNVNLGWVYSKKMQTHSTQVYTYA